MGALSRQVLYIPDLNEIRLQVGAETIRKNAVVIVKNLLQLRMQSQACSNYD